MMWWLLTSVTAIAASGLPGLFLARRSLLGQWLSVVLAVSGSVVGIAVTFGWFLFDGAAEMRIAWPLLPNIEFHVSLDAVSAVFLLPVFLISAAGAVFGLSYWKQSEHADNGRKLRLFYGLCAAGMALVVVARNSIVFLLGWEGMALAAFMLVATEDDQQPAREAGWIYLVATHAATLCLFGMFGLLWAATGSFELTPAAAGQGPISPTMANVIFILALLGFGFKAGVMPLHVWLPGAHATAPSHVSALMSGVLLKMGIYGLVRVGSLLPGPPLWWGALLLTLGVVSGVLGVVYAIGQHDLKRLLAYHSIENIGIIVMGLGLALVGRHFAEPAWTALGLAGALWHVWNHALFKSLLFFSAGSVIHAVHTREIDELGGLSKRMPCTALCFLVGAVAICGLPPLNGFVSEFLIYNGLFRTLGISPVGSQVEWPAAALAAPGLALIGALATACFVKAYGAVFLGEGRSTHAHQAHESGVSMIAPMLLLAACCVWIGLAPMSVAPLMDRAVAAWLEPSAADAPAPLVELAALRWIGILGLALVGLSAAGVLALAMKLRQGPVDWSCTWGCGYTAPSARMQYTSSSFAEMLVALFRWALRPRVRQPRFVEPFPRRQRFESEVPDGVLDELVLPAAQWLAERLAWFRVFHQGSVQAYMLYIFLVLVLLLAW